MLTDVVLPDGMTGPTVADFAETRRPGIAIVYTSGYALDGLNQPLLARDARFIPKPYSLEALAAAIRSGLDCAHAEPMRSTGAAKE